MKAVGKYIVINPLEEKDVKTSGGLILNEENREDIRYREGTVIQVGDEVNAIKSKDKIYYDRHAGFGIEIKQKQYKVIKESDVVIIL
jgi:co-chaperonin GroES (HSP10)